MCAATPVFAQDTGRLFGFIPNYATVEEPLPGGMSAAPPLTRKFKFKLADLNSFDPVVFPFVGLETALGAGDSRVGFVQQYGTAFADNTIGNFMTVGLLPSVTKEDPRYFRSGEGGLFRRVAYAASRPLIRRTPSGDSAFRVSRVAGNMVAAGLSNIYYSPQDRTIAGTMSRWSSLMMWNVISNELKEFWPDIRAKLRKH
jgi:hypothetical protein